MKRKQKELPKQRNPFVEHMRFKVCGAHGKPKKVQRRDDKMALKQQNMEMIKWYKFLRNKGYSRSLSFYSALYNCRRWHTEGEWPYGMKKKINWIGS